MEFQSVKGFARAVVASGGPIDEVAGLIKALHAASEHQPVTAAVRDNLAGAARALASAKVMVEQAYAGYRTGNAADINRDENPRGGRAAVEQKADVQNMRRDA